MDEDVCKLFICQALDDIQEPEHWEEILDVVKSKVSNKSIYKSFIYKALDEIESEHLDKILQLVKDFQRKELNNPTRRAELVAEVNPFVSPEDDYETECCYKEAINKDINEITDITILHKIADYVNVVTDDEPSDKTTLKANISIYIDYIHNIQALGDIADFTNAMTYLPIAYNSGMI
jgi:hypothetical protein